MVPSFQSASVAQILVLPALMEYELITGISVDFSATEEFSTVITRTYFALPSAEISTVFLPFFSSADWGSLYGLAVVRGLNGLRLQKPRR